MGLCLDSPGLTDVQPEFKQPAGRTQPLLPKVLCSSPMFSESGCRSPVQDRVDFQSLGCNKENVDFEMAGTSSPMSTESLRLDDHANVDGVCEGLSELLQCDTEGNKNMTMSSSLAALLTSDILYRTMGTNAVPACKHRPGLFRSPSMPERLHRPFLKRLERAQEMDSPVKTKRQKSLDSPLEDEDEDQERRGNRPLRQSMTTCNVDVTKVLEERNATELIGNFSKIYALPTVMGKHGDLKYISPETMAKVLHGEYNHLLEDFHIVDCRYPYEFKGGHIRGALNLHKADDCIDYFFRKPVVPKSDSKRLIVIFHCEFSSERGPKMCRLLREEDRNLNEYPNLYYPELYILKGGYKAFFPQFMNYCDPPTYCPMDHEDFQEEMLKLRKKSKSWAGERRRRELISRLRKM
ncbi:M-phase inducer phosphatase 1-B-like isoform X2 [Stegostoma tigrinum]|uniref:M-phase inducer phosphatase 1-B-like isoform X2 n=1 Tax=Stegostoma tigrinum TaxID=3053191 RepID=UPI00202B07CB|nr:M-phase inducer phosphatase 1-B-like isoform X2 [Stegostoma tigrinum]